MQGLLNEILAYLAPGEELEAVVFFTGAETQVQDFQLVSDEQMQKLSC